MRFFQISRVLSRFNHVARIIVNANYSGSISGCDALRSRLRSQLRWVQRTYSRPNSSASETDSLFNAVHQGTLESAGDAVGQETMEQAEHRGGL